VNVVLYQVEVSATMWSLVQRSPTEYGMSECDGETSIMRRVWPIVGFCAMGQNKMSVYDKRHAAADVILEKEHPVYNLLAVGWATGPAYKR
jgi:hypothetical protein